MEKQARKDPLRIGYSRLTLNAPLFAALETRAFGDSVELTPFLSTNDMLAALLSGRIDLASALTTESVFQTNHLQSGVVKVVLYNVFTTQTRADAIVVPAGATAPSCEAARLGRVGTYPAQSTVTYLRRSFGESLPIEQLPPMVILEALSKGTVNSAYLLEPQVSLATSRGIGAVACWSPLATPDGGPVVVGSHAVNVKSLARRGWTPAEVRDALQRGVSVIRSDTALFHRAVSRYT
ncbi:MAG TPA: ABC transporter substrate-binding protein, partial [Longimicrobium sp.]|nr:ABC transporter substrate-binding protein [Longimicrobium sp.]